MQSGSGCDLTMTSWVARRGGCSSFTIAELIGVDTAADSSARNHNNDDNNNNNSVDCRDIRQVDGERQRSAGAFHLYRPASVHASADFYQACLNWMRSRGTTQLSPNLL